MPGNTQSPANLARAQPPATLARRSNQKRDQFKEHCRQEADILNLGLKVYPCCYCASKNKACWIMPEKYEKCASCTRRGKPCVRGFHSDIEWLNLERSQQQIVAELELAEKLQAQLHEQLLASMRKILHLRKAEKYLKKRGLKMSEHNKLVSRVLDESNPISDEELEQFEQEYQQANSVELAAISGNLALGELNDQFVPQASFWGNFDATIAAGNSGVVAGSLSDSQ
jgi:hypothetical protein